MRKNGDQRLPLLQLVQLKENLRSQMQERLVLEMRRQHNTSVETPLFVAQLPRLAMARMFPIDLTIVLHKTKISH
jgi:hypothetical protein